MTEKQLKSFVDNNAKKIIKGIKDLKQRARELERFSSVTDNDYESVTYEAKAEAYRTALQVLFGIEDE